MLRFLTFFFLILVMILFFNYLFYNGNLTIMYSLTVRPLFIRAATAKRVIIQSESRFVSSILYFIIKYRVINSILRHQFRSAISIVLEGPGLRLRFEWFGDATTSTPEDF